MLGGVSLLRYFKPGSLRQGLILIVLVALLPVALVSIVQGMSTLENTRNLATSRLQATAKAVAERQRDPFIIAQHLLTSVASNPEVRNISPRCDEVLAVNRQNSSPIVNFVRSDATGLVRCSVLPYAPGTSLGGENWWQLGIKSKGTTISAPVLGVISQRRVLTLMLPVRRADGSQHGAVSASIDLRQLSKSVAGSPEGKNGIIAIVANNGQTFVGNQPALPFVANARIASGLVGSAESPDGQMWMYSVAPIYGPDLKVIYAEPQDRLMAAGVSQIRASILLPIGSILLASLAIWFGTHRLVGRWLTDLGRVAGSFARGDFSGDRVRFESAPTEISELSANLHTMAENIDKRNQELTLALEAKTELTREVHHRVKNNLQIITSLLTLQAGRVEEPSAQQVLGQTRARISALALIHRLLYQQDPDSERGEVALDNLIGELCGQLRTANRDKPGVELHCNTSAHAIAVDNAVPLALFAVEAVTNAYRHAFANGRSGNITLAFQQEGAEDVLTVDDDGHGFDADDDVGQMGLELMNAFASQLGGSLKIESKLNSGSHVTLRFPASAALRA